MKSIAKIGLITLATIFMITCVAEAQVTPNVSNKYTVAQIDEMYKDHKIYRPRDVNPPHDISAKFVVDFPNAHEIEWEKSNVLYEVEFEIGRDDYKAYYDMSGDLIMYKSDIRENELPAVVRNAALSKYPNFRFDDVDKIVKGNEVTYKVELEKGKLDVKINLKHDGTIISELID